MSEKILARRLIALICAGRGAKRGGRRGRRGWELVTGQVARVSSESRGAQICLRSTVYLLGYWSHLDDD